MQGGSGSRPGDRPAIFLRVSQPDWYEQEPSFLATLLAEVDRLRRRARTRKWLVILIGVVLTAALVRKVATKPQVHRARVILAISEGEANAGWNPTPLDQLRDYIATVLLSNQRLITLLDERKMFVERRAKFGDEFVLSAFRDMFDIVVWRNYFQYAYSYDERRSARVAVVVTSKNPEFSFDMAQTLAQMIQAAEAERRSMAAFELAQQAADIEAAARARLDAVAKEQHDLLTAIAMAEASGDRQAAAEARVRAGQVAVEWQSAMQAFEQIETATTNEALQAAVTQAGLALEIEIVDERRPPPIEGSRTPTLIMVALVGLLVFVPLAGVGLGAIDSRVHDAEDLARLKLPILGHVPPFPGDGVGALRDRGVSRRRTAFFRRWPLRRRARSSIRSSSSSTAPSGTGGSPPA